MRRDWCPLAKEAGEKCLMEILSGEPTMTAPLLPEGPLSQKHASSDDCVRTFPSLVPSQSHQYFSLRVGSLAALIRAWTPTPWPRRQA